MLNNNPLPSGKKAPGGAEPMNGFAAIGGPSIKKL